jgi:prepilin-type N-terminal cleavage/methylation domain-containing protein
MRVRSGFTIIELLVCIAVVALLLAILLPSLARAKETGRHAVCLSNQHQLVAAWTLYSHDYKEFCMPLAYWRSDEVINGQQIFWFGSHGTPSLPPDHTLGFISPYVDVPLLKRGTIFECPSQPWGTYIPQGPSRQPTSTYGYNGYYLSPSRTPGWGAGIGFRPWRRLFEIPRPTEVLVFADTLLPGSRVSNCALLDPPLLYVGDGEWMVNESPTTSFRHLGSDTVNASARADGGVRSVRAEPEWLFNKATRIGSIGLTNEPHYIPDAASWR